MYYSEFKLNIGNQSANKVQLTCVAYTNEGYLEFEKPVRAIGDGKAISTLGAT